jgi:two-component system, response regulator / RNA-binding antiterminator
MINATVARIKQTKEMIEDFSPSNSSSEERVVIERAKEMLIRQRNLEENEAYAMLRTMAMQRNMKIVDLSKQLLEVAKMLTI